MLKKTLKLGWYHLLQSCCRLFCVVTFKMSVKGLDNLPHSGPFILAGNHQSFLDPVFCGIYLRRSLNYLARDTLFKNRLFGWLLTSINVIPLKRDRSDIPAIKKVIGKLKQGEALCLYPEATRTDDGRIKQLKPGFGLLCRRVKVPLVPVLVEGAFECWPRNKKLFTAGKKIVVWYGRPIKPEQIEKMSNQQLAETLTLTLRKMQDKCRLKLGKKPHQYDTQL